ncbi:MAG: DUF1707 domain-containing protein [Streptosporangiaceae bacterium]
MSSRYGPRDLRASDADRERVVDLLAQAASDGRLTWEEHAGRVQRAYTARTLGELAGLTEDLARPDDQPLRLDHSRAVTAFFATQRREGRWVVPDRLVVTAVGGQVVLDLREALLHRQRTQMYVTVLGGQVNMLVPAGVAVQMHGMPGLAALASGPDAGAEQDVPAPPPAGTPVIEMHTLTVLGRISVRTPRPRRNGFFRRAR